MMLLLIAVLIFGVMAVLGAFFLSWHKKYPGNVHTVSGIRLDFIWHDAGYDLGRIDLSLVGIANFSGITAAYIMVKMGGGPVSILLGCIAAVIVGALCGCFNGFMIVTFRSPPCW